MTEALNLLVKSNIGKSKPWLEEINSIFFICGSEDLLCRVSVKFLPSCLIGASQDILLESLTFLLKYILELFPQ